MITSAEKQVSAAGVKRGWLSRFGKGRQLAEAELQKMQLEVVTLVEQKQRLENEKVQTLSHLVEAQNEIARLRQLSDEQGAVHVQALAHLNSVIEAANANLTEQTQEAELLLEQLHQVQEEFESLYLKAQADQSAAEQQLAQLNAQLQQEQAAKAAAEQNAAQQAAQLKAELEQIRAAKAVAEQHAAQQAQQLAQLTAELEQTRAAKAAAEQNAAQQAQQVAQLTTELEQIRAAKAVAEKHAAQQAQQAQQVHQQLEEIQQENELLLHQLHQVQEELEQHFLDKQKLQRECEVLQQRWARLERRQPGYLDYELIEPVAVDAVSDQPSVDWRVRNITLLGQQQAELAFSTLLKDGQVGIVLDGIELFPRALRGPEAAQAIAQFRRFGSRQWSQVLVAATTLEQFFAGQPVAAPQLSFDPVFWRQVLLPLVAELRALPAVFRFDGVTLKRELVHTDYEHLWLVLEGASLGQQHWPKFELRLGAADLKPGRFSRHPKLEFPLIDGKTRPFDSWYEESHDEFGGKFELRFDLDRQLMDLGVWSRLNVDDRKLLLSVNGVLGQALERLQTEQGGISRAWSDWQGLATGIIATLHKLSEAGARQQKAQAQPVPAPAAPTPPVEVAVAKKPPAKKATAKTPAVKNTAPGSPPRAESA